MFRLLSFSAFSVAVKFVVGFLITKVFALFLGPNGISAIGNIKNFMQLLVSVQTLGMQKGIIRYTSEYKRDSEKFKLFIGTLNRYNIIVSLLLCIILFSFSSHLAQLVFLDKQFDYVFQIVAFVIPFQGFHYLFFSLMQGLGNYQKVIFLEIAMNVVNLILTACLVYFYELTGGLIAVVLLPILYFLLSRLSFGSFPFFQLQFSKAISKDMLLYAGMVLFSNLAFPLIYILIRNQISVVLGAESAGFWEAVNQFSYFYFLALNSIILVYVLPKISEKTSIKFYRLQVGEYYKKIMPLLAICLLGLYVFRSEAIRLILAPSFGPVEELFAWQLIGDFLRAGTLIFTVFFHARRMIAYYVVTDMVLAFMTLYLSFYFLEINGLVGVVKAHCYTYIAYFLIMVSVMVKLLFYKNNEVH